MWQKTDLLERWQPILLSVRDCGDYFGFMFGHMMLATDVAAIAKHTDRKAHPHFWPSRVCVSLNSIVNRK